ncbi:MAG: hypothetical protein AUI85_05690 [Acidobacteriales bacterium 13_1_40CM_3_55_5]|nr:MAG: hypothetical protein AUI85_05690 [Acidobacteriales bacterium 13_1_40CM_3_55_5]
MGGGVSDYLDILVDPDFADETLAVIWNLIQQEPEWTMLDLTDLPGTSPLLHTWPDDFSFSKSAHDVCSGLTMSSRADDLKKLFPFRQLRNLRNARNRLQRAGHVHIEFATRGSLPSFLDTLFHLHGQRWSRSGKPGVLADPAIQSFHEVAAPQLLERGVLRLYGLRLNGHIIASLYTLFERDTACFYLQGFDPDYRSSRGQTQDRFSPWTRTLQTTLGCRRKFHVPGPSKPDSLTSVSPNTAARRELLKSCQSRPERFNPWISVTSNARRTGLFLKAYAL